MSDNLEATDATHSTDTTVAPEEMSDLQKRMLRQMDEPAFSNNAVAHCVEAWERMHRETVQQMVALFVEANDRQPNLVELGKFGNVVYKQASWAYRQALPPLTGEANIRDYIACVAHGAAMDAIEPNTASKLLYAAQVASVAAKRYPPRKEF